MAKLENNTIPFRNRLCSWLLASLFVCSIATVYGFTAKNYSIERLQVTTEWIASQETVNHPTISMVWFPCGPRADSHVLKHYRLSNRHFTRLVRIKLNGSSNKQLDTHPYVFLCVYRILSPSSEDDSHPLYIA